MDGYPDVMSHMPPESVNCSSMSFTERHVCAVSLSHHSQTTWAIKARAVPLIDMPNTHRRSERSLRHA